MKNFFIFISIFIFTMNCFSQNDSAIVSSDSLHAKQKRTIDTCAFHFPLVVKTDPLALIDLLDGGSAVLVAESFPTQRISVSMEIGTYYNLAGYGMKKFHGWRSGAEVRYYFNENPTWDYFCGVRYFYKKNGFERTDSIKIDLTQGAYARNYLTRKEVTTVDFLFGKRYFSPGKKFVSEIYCGVGLRIKNTTSDGLATLEADHRMSSDSFAYPVIMGIGSSIAPDFLFGIKIGFGVKKHQ